MELLFEGNKTIEFELEAVKEGESPHTLQTVIDTLANHHLKEKREMFIQAGTVRPGIIVLVNDTDWELLDGDKYEMQPNDVCAFISTLHGG